MDAVLISMLQTQSKLNSLAIGEGWQTRENVDFFLALSQEAAEGIDHFPWKWWAKQEENKPAAQMECVDMLHFALSVELQAIPDGNTIADCADMLKKGVSAFQRPIEMWGQVYYPATMPPPELFAFIGASAHFGFCHTELVFLLAEKLGLSFMELCRLYLMKATLNVFRQHNGYKLGTYIKHWAPNTEDNAFLPLLSEGINWDIAGAADIFYSRLSVKYDEVSIPARKQH